MTLRELIESEKCRVGKIAGTSKYGRYWLACEPIQLLDRGNGWDKASITCTLRLSHYADGRVEAAVHRRWRDNRNSLGGKYNYPAPRLLNCECVEEVEAELKRGIVVGQLEDGENVVEDCYQEFYRNDLFATLCGLGLPETIPGPDESTISS